MSATRRWLLVATALTGGCASTPLSIREGMNLPAGQWSSYQAALQIFENGSGRVTMPCSSVSIDGPVHVGVGGHFLVPGRLLYPQLREARAANVSGRVDAGGLIWLDVATVSGYPVRSAKLRAGAAHGPATCRERPALAVPAEG